MRVVAMLLALVLSAACAPGSSAAKRAEGRPSRIVSLSPAITATLVELGMGDRVRGCTPWCEGIGRAAVVGTAEDVDLERLTQIDPDLILVQRTSRGVSAELQRLAAPRGWRIELVPCDSLDHLRDMGGTLAALCGDADAAAPLAARWERVAHPPAGFRPGDRAVFVLPGDPPRAFGAGSYLADLWCRWGGDAWPRSEGWPQVQVEDLVTGGPRQVFVVGGEPSPALSRALADGGMQTSTLRDPRFLQPGPGFLAAVEAWRRGLERTP
jgi:iron complex transport system substrate-binding protein